MRVEHEYERCGAWAYLAAWDVRRAKIFGACVKKTGIAPFDERGYLVDAGSPLTPSRAPFRA